MNTSSDFFMRSDAFEPDFSRYDTAIDGCAIMPLLVDVMSLATMLAVSERTVYRLVEIGELPQPLHLGRLARWRTVDVVAFVDLLSEQKALSTANLYHDK